MNFRFLPKSLALASCVLLISTLNAAWSQTPSQIQQVVVDPASAGKIAKATADRTVTTTVTRLKTAANAATRSATAGLIDINTVSRAKLMTLPGIGQTLSQRIIKGRPYRAAIDVSPIIGNTTYARIANLIIASKVATLTAPAKPVAPAKLEAATRPVPIPKTATPAK